MFRKRLTERSGQSTLEFVMLLMIGFVAAVWALWTFCSEVLSPMQGPTENPGGAVPAISRSSHHKWNY